MANATLFTGLTLLLGFSLGFPSTRVSFQLQLDAPGHRRPVRHGGRVPQRLRREARRGAGRGHAVERNAVRIGAVPRAMSPRVPNRGTAGLM
jgi:hypothetical protein